MLWSGTKDLRKKAEQELVEYLKKTMSSSYGLFEEDYMHPLQESSSKNLDDVNRGNIITSISKQNDSDHVCRILPIVVPDQTLRNMRHKKGSHILKGTIARCEGCKQQFTTSTLIGNAIDKWNNLVQDSNSYFSKKDVQFPLSKEKIDTIAIRFPYDMESLLREPNSILEKILKTITLFRFNEHDYKHRKGCFKKSDECRFSYPRAKKEDFGMTINFESEPTTWYTSYGKHKSHLCHAFTMEPRRHLTDMFLNTNNPVVSNIFGFNNNVAMGNRNCIFYATLYTTKGTQNEEQFPFCKTLYCNH